MLDNASVRNTIAGNAMVNFGPSIDLAGDRVTANTPGGPHVGPNQYQNTPILTFAANGSRGVTLNSSPSTTHIIQFYASAPVDPLFGPQAQVLLGQASLTTDAAGNGGIVAAYTPVPGLTVFSATANDPSGDTSELSGPPDLQPLKASGVSSTFIAKTSVGAVLASVTDLDPRATAGRLAATVDWGDGSAPTAAVVAPSAQGYRIIGAHTYARSGTFSAVVIVVDPVLNVSTTATSTVQVAPTPIVVHGRNYKLTGKVSHFSNVAATFTDPGPALSRTSYAATISWGDGSISVGKITGAHGSFVVKASHKFKRFTGVRIATVTITDVLGRRTLASDAFAFAGK